MSSLQLVAQNFKLHNCLQLLESFDETANTAYYLYCAHHMPFANNTIPNVENDVQDTSIDPYQNMIFGKRLSRSDAALMIRRIDYTSNKVYSMYDDSNANILNEDYYCVVNNGAYSHVFECLYNNNGGLSSIQPNFTDINSNDEVYITSDNYYWKYLYSVSSTDVSKFATETYFPVMANSSVVENSINGALDVIKVENPGAGYDNYISGQFSSSDLRRDGNSVVYAINSVASSTNSFYEHCYLYITAGSGVGQYREVVSYVTNATHKSVVLNDSFDVPPQIDSQYSISPIVYITGDATQTINAAARAIINAVGNTVDRVEVLNRGADYKFLKAELRVNPVVPVSTNAVLRPIYSPIGGHGYDAAKELGAARICFSGKFSNSESNTVVTTNNFKQIGLLADPIFSNMDLDLTNYFGTFIPDETVYVVDPILLRGTGSLDSTNSAIVGTDTDFERQFKVNDYIYMQSGNNTQLAVIQSISNSTYLTLTQNAAFTALGVDLYQPNIGSHATATDVISTQLSLSNIYGTIGVNDSIVGLWSGATATVNAASRSGVAKNFNTFIQMYKYSGAVTSGTFLQNEKIYQTALAISNASLHSVVNTGVTTNFYVTNQLGNFNPSGNIVGATSGATATINAVYEPELVFGSGTILYIENTNPIVRQDDQTETFKLIFEF